MSGVFTANVTI